MKACRKMGGKLDELMVAMEAELGAVGTNLVLAFDPAHFHQLDTAYQLLCNRKVRLPPLLFYSPEGKEAMG